MKKRDLLRLHNAICAVEGRKFGVKFSYFLARTKLQLQDEISMLEKLREPTDEFKEYDNRRAQLALDHADRNLDGSPKINENQYVITTQSGAFQEALSDLREEYKEVLNEREKQQKDFNEILEEETSFDGIKIDLKDVPHDIEPVVIEVLLTTDLINEEEN